VREESRIRWQALIGPVSVRAGGGRRLFPLHTIPPAGGSNKERKLLPVQTRRPKHARATGRGPHTNACHPIGSPPRLGRRAGTVGGMRMPLLTCSSRTGRPQAPTAHPCARPAVGCPYCGPQAGYGRSVNESGPDRLTGRERAVKHPTQLRNMGGWRQWPTRGGFQQPASQVLPRAPHTARKRPAHRPLTAGVGPIFRSVPQQGDRP